MGRVDLSPQADYGYLSSIPPQIGRNGRRVEVTRRLQRAWACLGRYESNIGCAPTREGGDAESRGGRHVALRMRHSEPEQE